ncbi:hypothetical protein JCM11251_002067 [Rhodosporidiobolus azoricus]
MTVLEDDETVGVPRRRSPPVVSSFPPHPSTYPSSSRPGGYVSVPPVASDRTDYYSYGQPRTGGPYSLEHDQESEIGYAEGPYGPGSAWGKLAGIRLQRGEKTRLLTGVAIAALLYLVFDSLSGRYHHTPRQHGPPSPFPSPPDDQHHDPGGAPPAPPPPDSTLSEGVVGDPSAASYPTVNMTEFIQPRRPVPPTSPDPWAGLADRSWRGRDWLSASRFGSTKTGWQNTPDPPEQDPPPARWLLKAFEYTAATAGRSPDGKKLKLAKGMGFESRTGRPTKIPLSTLHLGKPLKGYRVSELGQGKMGEQEPPKVQPEEIRDDREDRFEEETLRRDWVKRAFMHAWSGYSKYAYGHDELSPVSNLWSDNYNGWGATLVDSLDTLLLMNMSHEYNLARQHVAAIDFTYLVPSGSKTFSTSLPPIEKMEIPAAKVTKEDEEEKKWSDPRLRHAFDQKSPSTISWFETLIRYLGSLISAHELSGGDPLMLDRARELADWLLPSFSTKHGFPMNRYPIGYNPDGRKSGRAVLAEVGSCILEMTKLSMLTGDNVYFEAAQRVMDVLDTGFASAQPPPEDPKERAGPNYRGRLGTLLPTHLDPAFPSMLQGEYTMGGLTDSFYEYLIKQAQLTSFSSDQYPRMYEEAIDSAYEHLIRPIKSVPGREDLTTIGTVAWGAWKNEMQHLTCFAGGMLGLGAKLLARPHDLETGINVTNTCVWIYESSATGIGGEATTFYDENEPSRWAVVDKPDGSGKVCTPRGSPVGVREANRRQIGRPETIESVFYMYRLTGDRKWQDIGWTMFVNWVASAITESGFATIRHVQHSPAQQDDSMESFVLGETLKYYYLLFSPLDFVSLDDWVFSTEAHPLWIPKPSASRPPTSFWSGPDESFSADLTSQLGEGTWVQKWARVQQAAALAPTARTGGGRTRKLDDLAAEEEALEEGGQGSKPGVVARPPRAPARQFVRPSEEEIAAARARARDEVPPIEWSAAKAQPDQVNGEVGGGGRAMAGRLV